MALAMHFAMSPEAEKGSPAERGKKDDNDT
jgi:hypothetical protein